MKTCIRPLPATGIQDRNALRVNDWVRCLCGQATCRDADIKKEET